MFKALGYGWGNSILAFISIGIGVLAPVILWRFGLRLRMARPYAPDQVISVSIWLFANSLSGLCSCPLSSAILTSFMYIFMNIYTLNT